MPKNIDEKLFILSITTTKNNNITKEFSSFARSLKDFKNATKTKNEPNMTMVNPRNL